MKKSTYSVIIPTYNSANTIEQSIMSAINQTYPPYEVIIIDDCSTDDTYERISQYISKYEFIKYVKQPVNMGVAMARNTGFKMATGNYVALLDSDDIWREDKMEIQMDFIIKNKCDFCCTAYSFITEDGDKTDIIYNVPDNIVYRDMLVENCVGLSSLVITEEIYKKYNMSDQYSHEDYAFVMSLLKDKKIGKGVDMPLMYYRVSPKSRSGNKKKAAIDRWIIYRKLLGMKIIPSMAAFIQYAYRGYKKYKTIKS